MPHSRQPESRPCRKPLDVLARAGLTRDTGRGGSGSGNHRALSPKAHEVPGDHRPPRPQTDAAPGVIRAAPAATAQFRSHGASVALRAASDPRKTKPEPSEMTRGLPAVRGRGLEPRWLLTASTSSGTGPIASRIPRGWIVRKRQKAARSGEFRSHVTGILAEGTRAPEPSPTWSPCACRRLAGAGKRIGIAVHSAGRCWNCCTRSTSSGAAVDAGRRTGSLERGTLRVPNPD